MPGQPRVVKKVVKRTVVRPARPSSSASRTSQRPGPPTTRAPGTESPATPGTSRRPAVDLGAVRQRSQQWGQRAGQAAGGSLGLVQRATSGSKNFVADRYWDARTYRLPPQPPVRSTIVVGLLLGLVAVVVGWISGLVFTELRGTTSGGGLWGGLVVVVLAVLAVWAGARLLGALGVENPGTVSVLAVILLLIVVLLLFIDLASGAWAWLLVPALGAGCFAVAHLLTDLAAHDPGEVG